jgi:hypothetical protein
MPEYVPFREVPTGAAFRFDKNPPKVRYVKTAATFYSAEGGGFVYQCHDPERPCLLLEPLQLADWKPGEFGIVEDVETDPFYLGYSKGQRWNGWACPSFPWESVLKIARDVAKWEGEGIERVVVDEENRRVWMDARGIWGETDPHTYYELETEFLQDGTPVWPIGSQSWTWNDKRDFAEEG